MNNRLKFGKQMDQSVEKDSIADYCAETNRKNVLDLGAGTCKISGQVADKGIHVVAIDKFLDSYDIDRKDNVEYIQADLVEYVKNCTDKKFDGVILSGILHELSTDEFNSLQSNLNKILTKDAIILIREPYYEDLQTYVAPFKSQSAMHKALSYILKETPKNFVVKFMTTKKLHDSKLPPEIYYLNMAFTYSYGEESWERELKEYRFAYSKDELINFVKKVLNTDNVDVDAIMNFDESYKKYFNICGYSDEILDSLDYTNSKIIAFRAV